MSRYNEKELRNGTVIYSSEKNPGKYPCWGLYDKKSGKDLLEPVFDSFPAWGTMNGHPVVFAQKGSSKKIYLVDKQKLLFNDYEIVGKDWETIPELHSKVYGDVYYVMKDMEFHLVTEDGKSVAQFERPVAGKIKIFDFKNKSYAIAANSVLELGTGKPLEGLSIASASKIVDAFTLQDSLFLIVKKSNSMSNFFEVYSYGLKKTVIDFFNYDNKQGFAITPNAFYYMQDDNHCLKMDKDSNKSGITLKNSIGHLIEIDGRVIIGMFGSRSTIDVDTKQSVMDGVAFSRFGGTRLMKTVGSKGAYNGIKDFDTGLVLAPAIFNNISDGVLIKCTLDKKDYLFDASSKSFDTASSRSLVVNTFSTIRWEDKQWE